MTDCLLDIQCNKIVKLTPLFLTMISYIDVPIREFVACCHVLIVFKGCPTKTPQPPAKISIFIDRHTL